MGKISSVYVDLDVTWKIVTSFLTWFFTSQTILDLGIIGVQHYQTTPQGIMVCPFENSTPVKWGLPWTFQWKLQTEKLDKYTKLGTGWEILTWENFYGRKQNLYFQCTYVTSFMSVYISTICKGIVYKFFFSIVTPIKLGPIQQKKNLLNIILQKQSELYSTCKGDCRNPRKNTFTKYYRDVVR